MMREFEKRYADKNPGISAATSRHIGRTAPARRPAKRPSTAARPKGSFRPRHFSPSSARPSIRPSDSMTHGETSCSTTSTPGAPTRASPIPTCRSHATNGGSSRDSPWTATGSRGSCWTTRWTAAGRPVASAVDVFNTASWPRTDLVTLSQEMSSAGDVVKDSDGRPVPSQRLSTGELVFLAKDMPPLAGRRYTIAPGSPPAHRLGSRRGHNARGGRIDCESRSDQRRDRKLQGAAMRNSSIPRPASG